MTESLRPEPMPIRIDQHGRYRVGHTNVLLDLVIASYQRGSTPETIIDQYPSLSLEEVYFAITYYLRHRDEIEIYLRQQRDEAEAGQQEDERRNPLTLSREILMGRVRLGN